MPNTISAKEARVGATDRYPHAEMADELALQIASKAAWLADFSSGPKRRPQHEIQTKERELRVLEQARDDYRRAADRVKAKAETGHGLGNHPVSAGQNRRFGERQSFHPRQ